DQIEVKATGSIGAFFYASVFWILGVGALAWLGFASGVYEGGPCYDKNPKLMIAIAIASFLCFCFAGFYSAYRIKFGYCRNRFCGVLGCFFSVCGIALSFGSFMQLLVECQ